MGRSLWNIEWFSYLLRTARWHNITGIIGIMFFIVLIGFIMYLSGHIIELLSLSLDLFKDQFIVFLDFLMEYFPIFQGILNLLIEYGFILYLLKTILEKLLSYLFNFIDFLIEFLNLRFLHCYHFLQIVAFEYQIGYALLILGFVLLADLD